jgi:hypothetical protein
MLKDFDAVAVGEVHFELRKIVTSSRRKQMYAIGDLIRIIVVCLYTDFLCWLFSLLLVKLTGV